VANRRQARIPDKTIFRFSDNPHRDLDPRNVLAQLKWAMLRILARFLAVVFAIVFVARMVPIFFFQAASPGSPLTFAGSGRWRCREPG
jgi:hypothetical protein